MSSLARLSRAEAAALQIFARSMVRELQARGYGLRHIVALANELIGLACDSIRADRNSTTGV